MFSKLDPQQYCEIKTAAHDLVSRYPLINAVVSRVQDGQVYADSSAKSFFVATKAGFCLFEAPEAASGFNEEFFEFLKNNHDIPNYIHIYAPAKSFQDYITGRWDKYRIRTRAQFRHAQNKLTYNYKILLPPEFRIASIQEIEVDKLEESFKLNFGRRYWNSRKDFTENAVGACILDPTDEPAAICYSACVVDGIAEVDTVVLHQYRGRRFLRIVSELFFNMTLSKNLIPHWDAFTSNTASYLMPQKFGLKPIQEYDLLSVLLRQS